jgi:lysophospholipase L1-like esterase
MNTVVCIGDSLTFGKNWANGSDLNQPLNIRLAQKYPGLSVVNLGINSNTSGDVNTRKADADAYNPFRVIVWIGINDISAGTALATIQSNLESIYNYYRVTKGYEVWAVTVTPCDSDTPAKNAVRNQLNNWIKTGMLNIDRVIDAWPVIRNSYKDSHRLPVYADPNTENHFNDAGLAAIVSLFP